VQARDVLRALGTYRDSQELLNTHVPYLQAQYLMASAANNDAAALPQHPGYQEGTAYAENVAVFLYQGAADLLEILGEYEDSAELFSQCYCQMAFAYMEQGLFEDALACRSYLNETDNAAVLAQYMTYCADEGAIETLTKAVRKRAELESAFLDDAEMTHLELVEAELEILADYNKDLMYYDNELKELVASYLTGLQTELSALDTNGFWADRSAWYAGNAIRSTVIETLIEKCDFLGEDPALQDSFIGRTEYYAAAATVEASLLEQLIGVSAQESEEIGTYLVYTNNTGFDLELVLTNEYCDAEGNTVFYHESDPVVIANGETVNLPFLSPETDEWENW
jgi:hypothetical protein